MVSLSAADLQQVWPDLLRVREAWAASDEPLRAGSALHQPRGSSLSTAELGPP